MRKTIKCEDKIIVLGEDELSEIRFINYKDDITKKYTQLQIMTSKNYHQLYMPIDKKIDIQIIFDFLHSNGKHFDFDTFKQ